MLTSSGAMYVLETRTPYSKILRYIKGSIKTSAKAFIDCTNVVTKHQVRLNF